MTKVVDWSTGEKAIRDMTAAEIAELDLPVVPEKITRRQFWLQAVKSGYVTSAEAVAAVSNGTLPVALSAGMSSLTADQQADFQISLASATEVFRNDTFTAFVAGVYSLTDADVDAFFVAAQLL